MRAIVTVIGKDKIGITAAITNVLAEADVNILDISQTIIQEYFTMIMLVDLEKIEMNINELQEVLQRKGETVGVSVKLQLEEVFNSMHHI